MGLALNFLSGTGVLLGTVIVLSIDVSDGDIGMLLAYGGGTYLYIAFAECMPKVMMGVMPGKTRLMGIFAFCIGAIGIGLVLLKHEHCIPPAADGAAPADPHAGHNHR